MIKISGLQAGYDGKTVLEELFLHIPAGQITCVIGPNGCGKSTLLKCLAKQLPFARGEISIAHQNIQDYSAKRFAQTVTYLKQARDIPTIGVHALVMHGRFPYLGYPRRVRECDKQVVQQVMQEVGVWHLRQKMLHELSGGERQKVYLAMALAQDTDIVLLDEPTTFLDIHYQLEFLELIAQLQKRGKTIVVILHDLQQALNLTQHVVLMNQGRIVFAGTPSALLETDHLDRTFQVEVTHHQREHGIVLSMQRNHPLNKTSLV